MKVLIFGGAGFLGASLDAHLASLNFKRCIFDNLDTGKRSHLHHESDFVLGDIRHIEEIEKVYLKYNPDIVIHLAAIHHIPSAEKDPLKTIEININGTANILEVLSKNNFKGKFGFASTGGIYQDMGEISLTETTLTNPVGIYTITKKAGEELINYYHDSGKSKFLSTSFRLFNLVGGKETNDHLLPAVLNQIVNESTINHGNLRPKRDYIHVDDVSRLIGLWAIGNSSEPPKCMNICSGKQYSVLEVIELCKQVTKKNLKLKEDPSRLRKGDRLNQKGDNTLAKNTYKWIPEKTLYEGINELWNDIRNML